MAAELEGELTRLATLVEIEMSVLTLAGCAAGGGAIQPFQDRHGRWHSGREPSPDPAAPLPVEETARCPAQAVRRASKRSCSSSRATTPGEVVQLALDGVYGRDRLLVRRPVVRALEALPPRRLLGLGMCRTRSFATRPSDITVQRAPIHVARTVSPRSYLEQPAGRSTPPRARSSQKLTAPGRGRAIGESELISQR